MLDVDGVEECAAPADKVAATACLKGGLPGSFSGKIAHNFAHGSDARGQVNAWGVAERFSGDPFKEFGQHGCGGTKGGGAWRGLGSEECKQALPEPESTDFTCSWWGCWG